MVYLNEPITLTRVAEYQGDLEKEVGSFNFTAELLNKDLRSTEFGIYDSTKEPYLLFVSHKTDGKLTKGLTEDSNLVLTITSYSDKLNKSIEKKFIKKLNLNYTPNWISNNMDCAGKYIFSLFEEHGEEEAMKLLKRIYQDVTKNEII